MDLNTKIFTNKGKLYFILEGNKFSIEQLKNRLTKMKIDYDNSKEDINYYIELYNKSLTFNDNKLKIIEELEEDTKIFKTKIQPNENNEENKKPLLKSKKLPPKNLASKNKIIKKYEESNIVLYLVIGSLILFFAISIGKNEFEKNKRDILTKIIIFISSIFLVIFIKKKYSFSKKLIFLYDIVKEELKENKINFGRDLNVRAEILFKICKKYCNTITIQKFKKYYFPKLNRLIEKEIINKN